MRSGSWGWRPRRRPRRRSAPSRSSRREPRWPRNLMLRGQSRPGMSCVGCCAAPGTCWRRLRRRPATRTWRPGSPRMRWPMTRSTRARTVFSCPPARRPGLADRILRQTRGHTLFVVEVLRALAEGDSGLPESLRSTVQARVRRLGPEAEHLLRVAAVLGAAIDPVTVAAVADVPPAAALQLCELALRARLLVAAGRDFEFANDLIREALYATTPEPTRLAYHQRAADRLTSQPESLARHAAACGDWLRAARALLSAADEAFRRFAVTDSAALATQALEAAERAGDLEVAARARVIRGRAHEGVAAVSSALADFSAGAAAARAAGDQRLAELLGDQAAAADLLARLAIIATNTLRFERALEYGRRAVAAGRAAGDDQALAAGLDGLKTAHAYLGHVGPLASVLDELEPLLRRQGDLFRLQHAVFESAFVPLAAGDWDQAIAATESAIQINRRSGYPHWAAPYVAHLGWLARLRGRDGEGLKEPVMPWCSDGPDEAELGGALDATLSDWADRTHAQGGTVVAAHFPNPNGEPAVLVATGRADAVEMLAHSGDAMLEYYRYLNSGYRLPLVGGTDKMSSAVPVGLYRTYARLDEEFSYEAWCRAVRSGRTFLSGGPLVTLTVDGGGPGDTVALSGPGTVSIHATVRSIFPLSSLEVVRNGEVVAKAAANGGLEAGISEELRIDGDSWIACRAFGADYHLDESGRRVFAHTSPVYVACGGDWTMTDPEGTRYIRTLVEGAREYVRHTAVRRSDQFTTHHHGEGNHLAWLERPFVEALRALEERGRE